MIRLRQRSAWERLLRLIPFFRRRQDAALAAAIRTLVDDPDLACEVDGVVIPNGRGAP
jgi:hypothetical protein